MTAYTQADAEKAGWFFGHAVEETTSPETGVTPGDYRAEKPYDGGMFTEQAETEEKLVERIGLYENDPTRVAPAPSPPVWVDDSFPDSNSNPIPEPDEEEKPEPKATKTAAKK